MASRQSFDVDKTDIERTQTKTDAIYHHAAGVLLFRSIMTLAKKVRARRCIRSKSGRRRSTIDACKKYAANDMRRYYTPLVYRKK